LAVGLGISGGPLMSAAVDTAALPGGSIGLSLTQGLHGGRLYSVRSLFPLVRGNALAPAVAVLGGFWGQQTEGVTPGFHPFAGFALTYAPSPLWAVRLNLGYSFWTAPASGNRVFAAEGPLTGFEVAYCPGQPWPELTLGWNGADEILGIAWRF
jgi:hypothetical protein